MENNLRLQTELLSFEQDETGVTALVVDRKTGMQQRIRTAYLVAADGANSLALRTLAIPAKSFTLSRTQILAIDFRADLSGLLPIAGMNVPIFWTIIVMHVVSAVNVVGLLTTLTREQAEQEPSPGMDTPS